MGPEGTIACSPGNSGVPPSDHQHVASSDAELPRVCADVRVACSARLDGEATGVDDDAVGAHLARCPACAAHERSLTDLDRRVRLRPAEPVPDLAAGIVARVAPPTPARVLARVSLLVVAVGLAVVSLPVLLEAPAPHAHESRHFAIYDLALAGGFAYVVLRPWVARTLFPLLATLGALMLAGALVDTAIGGGTALGDAHHLLQFVGIGLVAALAAPPGSHWVARRHVARRAHVRRTPVPAGS